MSKALVCLEGVGREFEDGRVQAVRNISLEIGTNEYIVLFGPSGSGKTTLLNLITGLDRPTFGNVVFEGHTIRSRAKWSALRSRRIGFVFQSFNLLPSLTALENVQVPMFGTGVSSRDRAARAEHLLGRVGLADRMSHLPGQLSGGERQRLAIARSLANKPALLVADEPTGNLDQKSAADVMSLLHEIHAAERNTVVLVTHDQRFISYANRVLHMQDGRLLSAAE